MTVFVPRCSLLPGATHTHTHAYGRPSTWRQGGVYYFPGIFALLRAMASSTAFSCFSSSSRRDRVLLDLPEPEPDPDPGPEPGTGPEPGPEPEPGPGGLPAAGPGPFPEDLVGGDMGLFLSP